MAKSKEIVKVADKEVKVTIDSPVVEVVAAETVTEIKVTAEPKFGENKIADMGVIEESIKTAKLNFKAISELELDKVLSFRMPEGWMRKKRLNENEKSSKLVINGATITPIVSGIEMGMEFYSFIRLFGTFESLANSKTAREKYSPKDTQPLKCKFDLYVYSITIPGIGRDTGSALVDNLKQKIDGDQKVVYQILLLDNDSSMTIDTEGHDKWNYFDVDLLAGRIANITWAVNSELVNVAFKGNNSIEHQKVNKCLLVNSSLRLPKENNFRFGHTMHTVKNLNIINSMLFGCNIENSRHQGTIKNSVLENVNINTHQFRVIGSNVVNFNYFNYQGFLNLFDVQNSSLKGITLNSDAKSLTVKDTSYRTADNSAIYLNGAYDFDIQSMFDINLFRVTDNQEITAVRSTEGFVMKSNYTPGDKIFVYKPDNGSGINHPYNNGPRPFMTPPPLASRPASDFYTLRTQIIENLNIDLFKGRIQGTMADQILDDVVSTIGRRFDISEHARQIRLMLPPENRFAHMANSVCHPYSEDGFDF